MIDLAPFEARMGLSFIDREILKRALTHRSFINENPKMNFSHNERLEFLGDAVVELIVTDYLFRTYPEEAEGQLTAYRSALVNAIVMSEVALALGVNDFLLLSKGERKDTGRARQTILANTYEALVGAVYLDQGYAPAEAFVMRTLVPKLESIIREERWKDPKSRVQEVAQERVSVTPSYRLLAETGPDHDKYFTIGIFFGQKKIAEGKGRSKQEAEQEAARAALENNSWQ